MHSENMDSFKPRIAFFDIDGTRVPHFRETMSPGLIEALRQLQKNGCQLIISTGRPASLVSRFDGIEFDGILCFNGQMFIRQGKTIFSHPLDRDDIALLLQNGRSLDHAVCLCSESRVAAPFFDPRNQEYLGENAKNIGEFDQVLQETIYQGLCGISPSIAPLLLKGCKNTSYTYWCDRGVDIIPKNGGKGEGMKQVMEHFEIDPSYSIAFGDGMNDLEMLETAQIGIAMGNSQEELKEKADHITEDVKEDGIAAALRYFHWI